MSQLTDIRQGLAANLASIAGCQISPYILANPTLPVVWIRPSPSEGIEYHGAMRNGLEHWTMLVQATVATVGDIAGQKKLDDLLASTGVTSVKAAIESDKQLTKRLLDDKSVQSGQPAAAQDLVVKRCSGYQEYARPDGTTVFGADWIVLVHMNGG